MSGVGLILLICLSCNMMSGLASVPWLNVHHMPSIKKCKLAEQGAVRDCSNFGMRSIPYDVFREVNTYIRLSGNPFVCDCSMLWFLQEPGVNYIDILDYDKMSCAEPKHLVGKSISSLSEKDICSKYVPISHHRCQFLFRKSILDCRQNETKAKYIPFDVSGLSFYTQLYLAGNYDCDCTIVPFIRKRKSLKFRRLIRHDKNQIMCGSPKDLKNKTIDHTFKEQSVCRLKENDPCLRNPRPCGNEMFLTCRKTESGYKCIDIDECFLDKHNCKEGEECVNKKNGFTCQCQPRHVKNPNGDGCIIPVDACDQRPSPCNETTKECITGKIAGTYTCQDIDECALNKHGCHKDAVCTNLSPGYKCRCRAGFKEYSNGRVCKDINECLTKVDCSPDARCINSPGSYNCICHSGYHGNGKQCQDVNECLKRGFCAPNARCVNTKGSFKCTCNKGYQGNGKLCSDIDECSTKTFSCPVNAKCVNTAGSYKCVCITGYFWNGEKCLDIDECASKVHTCDKNAVCTNLLGGYKCLCKQGFEHFKEGRLCLKEEAPESSKTPNVFLIAGPLALLFFVTLTIVFIIKRKKRKGIYEDEEPVVERTNVEQKFVFHEFHDPTIILPSVSMLSDWSEEEKDYDED